MRSANAPLADCPSKYKALIVSEFILAECTQTLNGVVELARALKRPRNGIYEHNVQSHLHVAGEESEFQLMFMSAKVQLSVLLEINFPPQGGKEVNNFQMAWQSLNREFALSSEKNQEHFSIQYSISKTKAVMREVEIDFESASMLKDH